jgi:hypothetical protein
MTREKENGLRPPKKGGLEGVALLPPCPPLTATTILYPVETQEKKD